MQKALIILVLIINAGCNARLFTTENQIASFEDSAEKNISDIFKNNISGESFFIQKAELSVTINNSTNRLIFTGKFEKPDKYLISIKSLTGIEGARIYIDQDTILINDRINKRILYGNPVNIEKITGIPFSIMNIVFGDLIIGVKEDEIVKEKINNELIVSQTSNNRVIKSVLDTGRNKVKSVVILNKSGKEEISLKYSKYSKKDKHYPSLIEIHDIEKNMSAKVRILRIETPWKGIIEFVPGTDYKKEELK